MIELVVKPVVSDGLLDAKTHYYVNPTGVGQLDSIVGTRIVREWR